MNSKAGDKVRKKTGEYTGVRAVVRSVHPKDRLEIELANGDLLKLSAEQVTNFRPAAR